MNVHEKISVPEVAASLALSLSLTLTFLRAIRQMSIDNGAPVPTDWDGFIDQLHTLFLDSCGMAGKDFIETADEKSESLMNYVLRMSRPDNPRDNA